MKIGIIGTGTVGRTFAERLKGLGHDVMIGTRRPDEKLTETSKDQMGNAPFSEWYGNQSGIQLGTFSQAISHGDILINATMGVASVAALSAGDATGKIILDVSNPLDFSKGMPPSLIPALSNTHSLGEELQNTFPGAFVVKTLNTMWCGVMVNPSMVRGGDHTNFICGNDAAAKSKVRALLHEFGWKDENILDLGDISSARGTEGILPVWLRIWGATQNGAFNLKVVS